MSTEAWKYAHDLDNDARLLGYGTTHTENGFVLYRLDEPMVLGEWFSIESEARAYLAEVETFPRWRLPLDDNPIVVHHKYGVIVTDETGRWFAAPAYQGDAYIYMHCEGQPHIGNWEQCD